MVIGNIKSQILYNLSLIPSQVRQLSNFVKPLLLLLPALGWGDKHTQMNEKWTSALERCINVIINTFLDFLGKKRKGID